MSSLPTNIRILDISYNEIKSMELANLRDRRRIGSPLELRAFANPVNCDCGMLAEFIDLVAEDKLRCPITCFNCGTNVDSFRPIPFSTPYREDSVEWLTKQEEKFCAASTS